MTSNLHGPASAPLFDPPLWRSPTKLTDVPKEQQWSYAGDVAPPADVDGPVWSAIYDLRLVAIVLTLQSASASDYVIQTFVDAVSLATTTLTAGQTFLAEAVGLDVAAGALVFPRLEANAAGDGTMLGISYNYVRGST